MQQACRLHGSRAVKSLNQLASLRHFLIAVRRHWLRLSAGARIDPGARVSLSATFLGGFRDAITIGEGTMVAFKTLLIAREPDGSHGRIRIGRHCFIGGGATILPGVTIGDEAVVGAGAIVFEDVPARCIVAGNPARIIRENIEVGRFGRFLYADGNALTYYRQD